MNDQMIDQSTPKSPQKSTALISQNIEPKRHRRITLITAIMFIVITMVGLGVYIIEYTPAKVSSFRKGQSISVSFDEPKNTSRGKGRGAIGLSIIAEKSPSTSYSISSEQVVTGKNVEYVEMANGELLVDSQQADPAPHNTTLK